MAKELCARLVCPSHHGGVACRSSVTSFCHFSIVNWKKVRTHHCGPIKNKTASCSHSSYSLKLSSGFKVFICDLMIFHINLLNQIVFGHCEEHWANEGCTSQESIWWHSSTLPAWQEQTETPVSIRTHFLPVQTCIIRLIGRIKSLLQVLNSLTDALKRNSLSWDVLAAENKEMISKTIQAKTAAFKQFGKWVCSFIAFVNSTMETMAVLWQPVHNNYQLPGAVYASSNC